MPVRAFIKSHLDYCSSLFTGLPKNSVRKVQRVNNAAARVLTKTKTVDHITPLLKTAHRLPISFKEDFKVLLLVHKASPPIRDFLSFYVPDRSLRFSTTCLVKVPHVSHEKDSWGCLLFSCSCLWISLCFFKSKLKTWLFNLAFNLE